jgi:amino acid adenylation domain-containing protein
MTLHTVLARLHAAGVRLRNHDGQLVVSGRKDRVDGDLLEALRGHRADILELLAQGGGEWWSPAPAITPEMLPLVELTQAEIDRIVAEVPGGARNVQDIYPLAPLQEGILFHHLMAEEGDPYLLASMTAFDTRGRLQAYLDALQAVADRHDILRTAVVWEGLPEPVQVVWRTAPLPVEELALDPADGDVAAQLHARFHPRRHRIDLARAPLLRLHVAHDAANDRWVLLQLMHHLLDDNTSLRVLHAEIRAHLEGRAHELPAPLPFRDYVAQARLGVSRQAHEAYFRALLGDVDEPAAPFGLLDAWGDGSGLEEARLAVDGALAGRLRARARALGVSAASVFHLAWALVLARASGRDDVVFGTVLFGRMQGGQGAHRVMGPFINTLPVRVRLDAGVEAALRAMHGQLAELLVHEHASLALAQRCSGVRAPAPLFTSLLNYRRGGGGKGAAAPARARGAARPAVERIFSEERTNYPLALAVDDGGERGIGLQAQTPASVGAARVCALVHRAVEALVEALEAAPDRAARSLDVLPEAERRRVVEAWSGTEAAHPPDACVHERFEAQARRTPHAAAVVSGGEALSYAELDRRANRLAHRLRTRGVGPEAPVGVCLERGVELVVAILAVLKAGGAYVPLDPRQPAARVAAMLDDAGARLVISSSTLAGVLPPCADVLRLDEDRERIGRESGAPLPRAAFPDALAYVVFTSGSTGRPKGVAVPHAALANHMAWMQRAFPLGPDDRVLQKTPVGFDASVWEFWAPLLAGAALVVAPPGAHRDPAALLAAVRDERITVLQLVPSMLGALLQHGGLERCATLRRLFCGGEALPAGAARQAGAALPGAAVVNLYGPTESTIDATWHPFDGEAGGSVPIGRAVDGVRTYVLDPWGRPALHGVAGELYLGGAQLARGYLGRPGWTAERFVPDGLSGRSGARLYRTGDRVRWLPSGALEFLGRVDGQVKVRGFRIEPGEVEACLREHPAVHAAVVVARQDAGDVRLAAYWVGDEEVGAEALRRHAAERLPEHMVPAAWVRLDALPLTPNGKVDRGALPAPGDDAYARRGHEAPEGEVEGVLAEIWSEVLGVERVGRRDHFFDLGGHSLLAVQVVSRVRQALRAEARIGDLFEHPVLADFARELYQAGRAGLPPVERVDRAGPLPLSFAQQRLWFLERLGGLGGTYHVPTRLRLRGPLDRGALRRALDAVVARHEALRTTFVEVDGEPVQRIAEPGPFHLVEHDLDGHPAAAAELRRLVAAEADVPFDLEQGPLARGRLVRLAADDHVLLVTLHHIVADGWSVEVLTRELGTLYGAFRRGEASPLAALPVQYADYAAWQWRWVEGDVLQRQAEYWKAALGGAPALLDLPADHPRPARQDHAGGVVPIDLDEALAAGLRALSRRHGATLFMTLLAGWATVLGRLSGQDDVVVGTPSANRGGREIEGLIGFFVNTLALRVDLSGSPTVAQVLARVKERALDAQHHQDIPFEQVVELVQPVRSLSHTPLFQVMFTWQNASGGGVALPGLALAPLGPALGTGAEGRVAAKFDLSLTLAERGGRVVGGLTYATSLFERATVERCVGCLRRVLEEMAADDALAVHRLALLPDAERRLVVEEWNATEAGYPRERCIHQLFEAQVERTPDAVAVVFEEDALSYGELNRRANRLAHALRALGVGPDARVGVCVERSLEMVVGLLAALKAGGCYVPLDPGYPAERLRYMLRDSAPAVLLTQGALRGQLDGILAGTDAPVLELDAPAPAWASRPETNPDGAGLTPGHLAYVIYTSGSTGRPKGVANEHRGVVNRLAWMRQVHGLGADEAVLQKTPFSFDVSVWELFWPLVSGARLVVARPGGHRDPGYLAEAIRRFGIGTAHFVPSMLQAFLEHPDADGCTGLRRVVCSGEALPAALARRVDERLPRAALFNLYGPTEAAVDVTWWRCRAADAGTRVPIGRPVANSRIYVLDRGGEPVPVGVVGELYIGGVQVARGYPGRPGLTAERFVPDPFGGEPGARLYRTGDLGRWRPDGAIEFLGRNDFQVKIRGFRVEPGEIEAPLREYPAVREALVVAREDAAGDPRLVAYYLADEPIAVDALKAHLALRLPAHMVPAAYVWLEAYPLTPSGKVDRGALPAPEGDAYARRVYEAPVGETERALAEIWSELLGVERVGRRDDFFELGGHSLLIVKLIERMRRRGLYAEVGTLFTVPVLAELAEAVTGETRDVAVPANAIPPGCRAITPEMLPLVPLGQADIDRIVAGVEGGAENVQDIYPLAPLQEGILFHHLLNQDGDPYVLSTLYGFEGRAQLDAYLAALQAVIDRHDVLRTAVVWEGLPDPLQVVWRRARLKVEEVQLEAGETPWARFDPRRTRLDIGRAPLMRVCVAHDAARGRSLLLLLMHHLISDYRSLEVLREEIRAHLGGREAELAPPLPFRNFVAQARLGVSPDEHRAFFTALLHDVDEPTAPFGGLDVRSDASGMREARLKVDGRLAARLRSRARALGVSAASIAHVAWAQVLARASGRDDVVFGTLLFGRMQAGEGSDRVMGPFINTLPIRIRLGTAGVAATVRETHVLLAKLLHHEHASLALAQRCSGVQAPAPLFTALLNYRHGGGEARARAAAPTAPAAEGMRSLSGEERTNYPLALMVDDLGGGFRLKGQVMHASLDPARLCAFMHRALEGVVEALETWPERAVGSIDVLPADERARVLEEWNRTQAAFPGESCIHALFEAQVERTPGAAAVVAGGEALAYAELNARANRLAHHLRALGVGPDVRVGICVERGPEMVVGLLAVLKAGGAYVPLDPSYPAERLAYMLADSAPAVVLTQRELRDRVGTAGVPVLELDAPAPAWAALPAANPRVEGLTPEHLAYVIYTSGSTGRPKGVAIAHRSTVNLLAWAGSAFADADVARTLCSTSLNFDLAVFELFVPLVRGAAVWLVEDAVALLRAPADVTLINTVPSAMRALLDGGGVPSGVRTVNLAGEALKESLVERIFAETGVERVCNLYGPTETTTYSTGVVMRRSEGFAPHIGTPLHNTRVYVLDGALQPVPVGVPGELHIGGAGVARGYLGRAALTAERFVPEPFGGQPGARMYRTGDLARWRPDGTVEYLGRVDHQVKVRGFRIELGEIEARLVEHAGVREAVVLAREDTPGDTRLVAYVVGDPAAAADVLRAHLGQTLPAHMVPAAYVRMHALPLTPNGKLDRKALPAPEGDAYARRGYEAPVGEREEALAEIWADVLGVERVGRWDHFFALGGHSLAAVRVISRVRQALGEEAAVADLFARPVLADFARGGAPGAEAGVDLPVAVRAGGSERPLFLVHDGVGSIDYAQVLGWQLGPDIPVYALPPLLDAECSLRTMHDMGARLVRMIQSVQPSGPYRIAGHSFGGNLAYEAAAQLIARNQEVEFLGLFDTSYTNASEQTFPQLSLADVFRRLCTREGKEGWSESTLLELLSRPELADLGALIHAGCEAGLFAERFPAEEVSRIQQQMWFYPLAVQEYTPPRIDVPVCYFEAMESPGSPSEAWRAFLAEASVRVTPVPGTHTSMMRPDHVPVLGQALSREIARTARNGDSVSGSN